MYVIPTTVIAESPTPVSRRVTNSPAGPHANAFSSEKPLYHRVVTISALFRPKRSENHPPVVAPMNMPMNVADTMKLSVGMARCQDFKMAGAAKAKVFRSPNSKKKMKLISHKIRR